MCVCLRPLNTMEVSLPQQRGAGLGGGPRAGAGLWCWGVVPGQGQSLGPGPGAVLFLWVPSGDSRGSAPAGERSLHGSRWLSRALPRRIYIGRRLTTTASSSSF